MNKDFDTTRRTSNMKDNKRECYNSGWQDGFCDALEYVIEAINREYNEADREGDDEYINEHIAGWNHVENIIKEMKESYSEKNYKKGE